MMKKKTTGYFGALAVGLLIGLTVAAAPALADKNSPPYTLLYALLNHVTIEIDGVPAAGDNFVVDGTTYIPLREAAELLGKEVYWDEAARHVTIANPGVYIEEADSRDVAATVNNVPITKGDLRSAILMEAPSEDGAARFDNAFQAQAKKSIELENAARAGFVTDDSTAQEAAAYVEQYRSYYGDQFSGMLSSYKMSAKAFRSFMEQNILLDRFRMDARENAVFTDGELQAGYEKNSELFLQATAKHILISSQSRTEEEAKKMIEEIAAKIKKPTDFDALMKEYSEDPGSKDLEDGMTFFKGEMVPEFETAAFSQEIGIVGTPVKTSYGYHLILVTKRAAAPLDEVRAQVEDMVFQARYLAELEKAAADADIQIFEEVADTLK